MAKHVATIRANLSFRGMTISTTYVISKRSPFNLAVKHRKTGGYNLILYQKVSAPPQRKKRHSQP
jgi:hypothetical protein